MQILFELKFEEYQYSNALHRRLDLKVFDSLLEQHRQSSFWSTNGESSNNYNNFMSEKYVCKSQFYPFALESLTDR
jgi:hypothetical protein